MSRFVESGMTFEFDDSRLFRIEESPALRSKGHIKACECVVVDGQELKLIEAKSSAPNPETPDNAGNVEEFMSLIEQKFVDTLLYTNSLMTGRNADEACPESISSLNPRSATYKFFLVISGFERRWLPAQQDMLKKVMAHVFKSWNIADSSLKVINAGLAREMGLIR